MGIWLFAYWKYLAGAGWPQTTRAARVRSFRSLRLTRRAWLGALGSGGLAAMSLIALELVVVRLVHIPAGQSAPGNAIPIHSLIPLAVMSAFASAIPEEVGFRGYMQAPLERGNHPVFAIGFVAIVFGLTHLSHGVSILLLFDFSFGLVYGVLAFYADSLLPGIILHCALNVVLFFVRETDCGGDGSQALALECMARRLVLDFERVVRPFWRRRHVCVAEPGGNPARSLGFRKCLNVIDGVEVVRNCKGCFAALRVMRSALYGVGVYDLPTIAAVVLVLALVTLLAATVPVLRIARIDPATTLRDE